MASLKIACITVGEQITAEQLIEKRIIMRISRHDHKPTIHRISANTPQRVLHRIDLQEHRGEHGIENQREREEAI